ncbi:hypothetical protein LXL04_016314 [Taraxacum kok-saghyz]
MAFTFNNKHILLQGIPSSQQTTLADLHSMLRQYSLASFYTVTAAPTHCQTSETLAHSDPTIHNLLQSFTHLFTPPQSLPSSRAQDHHIPTLPTAAPVNVKPYRYPHYQKEIMTNLIKDMLRDGIIIPSNNPYSSHVLLVRKKDGTWRFCVDYRALNAITIPDRFPIPTVDELLDELHGAHVFSKIDLLSGYHKIRVASSDTHKTAFHTVDGHCEFLVMPFGLSNAPSTFQSAMNDIFREVLRKFVLVFFDDILIYNPSLDTHYQHLQFVFQTLSHHQYHAKYSKCTFAVTKIPYMGHIISATGVRAEPDKLDTIQRWPAPKSLTSLHAFLGLTGYYRRFVQHYATIAAPLTDLLKYKACLSTPQANTEFLSLKSAMSSLIQLALPDFSTTFDVTTDASRTTIGAVLSQHDKPIVFFSKKLNNRMQNASTYVRELYAITEAVKKWRQYLLGCQFRIFTDQRSLKHLLTQVVQTPEQQKWATKLLGNHHYWLSQHPKQHGYKKFAFTLLLTLHLQETSDHNNVYTIRDDLVYQNGRVYIPDIPNLRSRILYEFHASHLGGHAGVAATTKCLSAAFVWPNMKPDVTNYIKEYGIYQTVKYPTRKPYGLLQSLPLPAEVWSDISMDFITHLPPSHGKTTMWVIVDRFTKFAHFISLPTHYTAISLATTFLHEIYRLHGIPRSIVSDRDLLFLSQFWKELFKQLGTKLLHSTAYHPQTDGQTEVVNRCLQGYLRSFASDAPRQWHKFLYLVEFWYNTSYHSGIEMTPFQELYGRLVPTIHHYTTGQSNMASIDTTLAEHQQLRQQLKSTLTCTRQRMTDVANRKRLDKHFDVGDLVFLNLHNYRQQSVEQPKRYYGPFPITERIRDIVYRLQLPPHSKIHLVFHVSLLKQDFGHLPVGSTPLPALMDQSHNILTPDSILQQQVATNGQQEALIQWKDHDSANLELEDEFVSETGGIDTSPTSTSEPITRPKRSTKIPARLLD